MASFFEKYGKFLRPKVSPRGKKGDGAEDNEEKRIQRKKTEMIESMMQDGGDEDEEDEEDDEEEKAATLRKWVVQYGRNQTGFWKGEKVVQYDDSVIAWKRDYPESCRVTTNYGRDGTLLFHPTYRGKARPVFRPDPATDKEHDEHLAALHAHFAAQRTRHKLEATVRLGQEEMKRLAVEYWERLIARCLPETDQRYFEPGERSWISKNVFYRKPQGISSKNPGDMIEYVVVQTTLGRTLEVYRSGQGIRVMEGKKSRRLRTKARVQRTIQSIAKQIDRQYTKYDFGQDHQGNLLVCFYGHPNKKTKQWVRVEITEQGQTKIVNVG